MEKLKVELIPPALKSSPWCLSEVLVLRVLQCYPEEQGASEGGPSLTLTSMDIYILGTCLRFLFPSF